MKKSKTGFVIPKPSFNSSAVVAVFSGSTPNSTKPFRGNPIISITVSGILAIASPKYAAPLSKPSKNLKAPDDSSIFMIFCCALSKSSTDFNFISDSEGFIKIEAAFSSKSFNCSSCNSS